MDCEMTGLDLSIDELIEVAVVITDYDLVPVDDGFQVVIKPDRTALENMSDFVRAMHSESGLLAELDAGKSLAEAEYEVLEYVLSHVPDAGTAPLAGNTIGTDRAFLAKFMPRVDAHLHYRSVDVSSIKELSRRWYPRVFFQAPAKHGGHRALADILESIRELDYYRSLVFVDPPGPSTDQAQAAAASAVDAWAPRVP
ncbi:MAG: oligoribonuclease [Microbacteriaceae bacterium]|nr:oligoribonuclease [Microbacteriaceae bacterium]